MLARVKEHSQVHVINHRIIFNDKVMSLFALMILIKNQSDDHIAASKSLAAYRALFRIKARHLHKHCRIDLLPCCVLLFVKS